MQEVPPQHPWSPQRDEIEPDAQLKQALRSLELENSRLKHLVVQLSQTIIRNVTAKR